MLKLYTHMFGRKKIYIYKYLYDCRNLILTERSPDVKSYRSIACSFETVRTCVS